MGVIHLADLWFEIIQKDIKWEPPFGTTEHYIINNKTLLHKKKLLSSFEGVDFNISNVVVFQTDPSSTPDTDAVFRAINKYTNVTEEEIKGRRRLGLIKTARHLFHYCMRKKTLLTLESITQITNKDHATAINSIKRINEIIDTKDKMYYLMVKKTLEHLQIQISPNKSLSENK